jgi:p38 MAP kinase
LEKMPVFDPRTRINATDALAHEYLAPYHDPTDEPVAAEMFDWSFDDADLPVNNWKVMMYSEILGRFRSAVPGFVRADTLPFLARPDFQNLGDIQPESAEGPLAAAFPPNVDA